MWYTVCIYIHIFRVGTTDIPTPTSTLYLRCHYCKTGSISTKKTKLWNLFKTFHHHSTFATNRITKKTKNPSSLFDGISFLLLITFRWGTFFGMKHLRYFLCTSISLSIPSDIIRSSHIWKPHIGDLGNPLFVQSSWMNPWSFLGLDLGVPDLIWLPAAMEIHVLSISKECSSVNIHMAFEVRFRSW